MNIACRIILNRIVKQSLLLLAPLLLAALPARATQSVSLGWDPSSDPNIAGYVVYYGCVSGTYTNRLDVGTNTEVTVAGLKEGSTNYFVVTAYNAARIESAPSQEIAFLVPGIVVLSPGAPAGITSLRFPVAPAHWYEVQASQDLNSWTTLWQTAASTSNAWVSFQDSQAGSFPSRFYRLVLH